MKSRTAIVTGAASGLGRAIAVRLAKDGWTLALVDIDISGANKTLAGVEAVGGNGIVEKIDVSDESAWRSLVKRLRSQWTHLDLVVNNAGVCGAGEIGDFPLPDWHWILQVNLLGVIHGCHICLPWLKENPHGGHIINTASIAGLISAPNMGAYCVTKAGVVALSETMFAELKTQRIGVTVLCPGFFQTGLLNKGRFVEEQARTVANNYMQKSGFSAEDVADAAIRAMHRKQMYVVLGMRARLLWRMKRFSPRGFLQLASIAWKKTKEQEQSQVLVEK